MKHARTAPGATESTGTPSGAIEKKTRLNDRERDYRRGVLIWLDRDGCRPPNNHESASGVCRELADHRIANNGTVEELHAEVLRVLGLEVAR